MRELRHGVRQTGGGLSLTLRTLEFISNDLLSLGPSIFKWKLEIRTSPICVLVHTYNPRAWKEPSKVSLGYRVKNPISTKEATEKQRVQLWAVDGAPLT